MAEAKPGQKDFKWEGLEPMPTKRVFSTPVAAKGQLYVIGGCDARGMPLDDFQVYNPNVNPKHRWKRLANMPTKRAGTCAVAVANKIIAMGGVSQTQEPLDVVELYDIEHKKWKTCDSLRDKIMGISAVERDGRIITVGGMGPDTNPRDYLMSYDLETDKWSSLPAMPTPRYATFSFLIKDRLYVLGGRQGKMPVGAFEVYNFEKQEWNKLPDIPSRRVFAIYVSSDTHIFSMGGLNQNPKDGFSDVLEIYDIEKEEWSTPTQMSTKRGDFAAAYLGGKVVITGGLGNEGKPLAAGEQYDMASGKWSPLPDMATPHCSCAYTMFDGKLHVIGGLSVGGATGAMDALSFIG